MGRVYANGRPIFKAGERVIVEDPNYPIGEFLVVADLVSRVVVTHIGDHTSPVFSAPAKWVKPRG